MIYSFSVILFSHDKSLELFLAAYQKDLKDSCSVYDGVSGLLASGFKEHPEPKGRWRMTRPGSAVRNHSQVTCVSLHLLHLELWEVAADSTQRRYRPATGHRAGPDAAFHLLRKPVHNHGTLLGDRAALLFFYSESGGHFVELLPARRWVKRFWPLLTVTPTWAKSLLQRRSVLPTLQPTDLKSTSQVFFFCFFM